MCSNARSTSSHELVNAASFQLRIQKNSSSVIVPIPAITWLSHSDEINTPHAINAHPISSRPV